jgi:hypothetical protein
MSSPPRRRPYVPAIELYPRVRRLVHRLGGQADHELGFIALFAKELEQDECANQAAWLMTAHAKRPPDGVAQQFRRVARGARVRLGQFACEARERRPPDASPHPQV